MISYVKQKKEERIVIDESLGTAAVTADVPTIEINDPYAYVTGNKVIALILIRGLQGDRTMPLVRTKKGGYMTQ
jgi:hypothetical protein